MELKRLTYFLEVERQGSISRAADVLGMSQQALSKSIIALENELGVHLFDRLKTGVRLTDSGEQVLHSAKRIRTEAQRLYDGLADSVSGAEPGLLRLGVSAGWMATLGLDWIERVFRNAAPRRIDILAGDEILFRRALSSGELDAALCLSFQPGAPGVRFIELARTGFALCLSKSNVPRDPAQVEAACKSAGWVVPRESEAAPRRLVELVFDHFGVMPRIACQTDSLLASLAMVADFDAVMMTPDCANRSFLANHNCELHKVDWIPDEAVFGLMVADTAAPGLDIDVAAERLSQALNDQIARGSLSKET